MKKLFLILIAVLTPLKVFATESTDYLSNFYSSQYKTRVEITSKKENIERYEEKIGEIKVSTIVHGIGYMKINKNKKIKISYICLFNSNGKIFWGYAISY